MAATPEERASAREDLCRYLSACYYEPAAAFGEERLFDALHAAASRFDAALAADAGTLRDAFAAHELQTLLVDHARLFLGPQRPLASPHGSAWQADTAAPAADPIEAVLALYREGGFEVDAGFQELPDHVAVALEFLYQLAYAENQARRRGDAAAAAAARQLQQRFVAEQLGVWVGPFTAAVEAAATTPFYRALAQVTSRFVRLLPEDSSAA